MYKKAACKMLVNLAPGAMSVKGDGFGPKSVQEFRVELKLWTPVSFSPPPISKIESFHEIRHGAGPIGSFGSIHLDQEFVFGS